MDFDLRWTGSDISKEPSCQHINWESIRQYAIQASFRRHGDLGSCTFAPFYHKGGQNLIRLLCFDHGLRWIVRTPLNLSRTNLTEIVGNEINVMNLVKERSSIPVPEVHGFELTSDNGAGTPFMLMDFIPGNTVMDSFGGYAVHGGETPTQFRSRFHQALADIQVQMVSIRFDQIGAINKENGQYIVGPIPGLGGPFSSASDFFTAWATAAQFPYDDSFIRQRTPPDLFEAVRDSIKAFPSKLKELAQSARFKGGPFPLLHPDFYNSNIIVNAESEVLSVIDWDNSFVVPWETVEIAKDLSIVPAAIDGPLFQEDDARRKRLAERDSYIDSTRKAEEARRTDCCLSSVLSDSAIQNFAQAFWLFQDGRIGFYEDVLREFSRSGSAR